MRITEDYGSYNPRRYGKPWICKITTWPIGGKPEVEWGRYLGDDNGGEVEIDAQVGDIIRTGQKDHRGRNTEASWNVVDKDGSLISVNATEARKAWEKKTECRPVVDLSCISDEELIVEIKRRGLKGGFEEWIQS